MKNKILSISISLLIVLFIVSCEKNVPEKPNVLFIAIDDMNDWIGCLDGHPQTKTPNIDRLANQGILFTNAHCQAPICGPSRASIFTGLYPSTTGNYLQLKDEDIKKANQAAKESILMPDYFEGNGYKTMAVGKLYGGGDAAGSFDEYGGRFSWMGPKPKERISFDPAWMGVPNGTQTDWGVYPGIDSLMTDYKSARWAVNKLGEEHDSPFFLAVGFLSPHVPWYASQKWFDMFPTDSLEMPPYNPSDFDDIPEMGVAVAEVPMMPTTEWLKERGQWKDVVQAYLACIAFMDHQVGEVLDALEKSPYADNTIVVLWSDHGYHIGEKNRFAKQALWQEDTRTPLIFRLPGSGKVDKCKAPVQLVDIYPTLVELCGLTNYEMADGNSLVPLLKEPNLDWEKPALSFYGEGNFAVTGEQYRLIQYEDGSQEFYDLISDPNEWKNLVSNDQLKDEKAKLEAFILSNQAPLSQYSSYNINDYFRKKIKEQKEENKH
jgi:arylsulfatase A-like enzyme